jgi:hypothetical protein
MPHWAVCICGHVYNDHAVTPESDACRYQTCLCEWFVCDPEVTECECEPSL